MRRRTAPTKMCLPEQAQLLKCAYREAQKLKCAYQNRRITKMRIPGGAKLKCALFIYLKKKKLKAFLKGALLRRCTIS
jgi:hypothetical protein